MATETKPKVKRKTTAKKVAAKPKSNERVKTYRVLRDGLRVGDSVRNFGDFMPEAKTMPTRGSLLRTDLIEEVWVDQEEFSEWEKDQAERDEVTKAELDSLYEGQGLERHPPAVDEDEEDEEEEPTPAPQPEKKTPKKTVSKKPVVKKGKTSGRKLEQRSV